MPTSSLVIGLLKKYTDITEDEFDVVTRESYYAPRYDDVTARIGRKINIDPKVYNVKLQQWNYHNLQLEDMHYFVAEDGEYFNTELLRDMNEFSSEMYHHGRLLNSQRVAFTMPHSFRMDHYQHDKDFMIRYQEYKTGYNVQHGKPVKMLSKLPWLKKFNKDLLIDFSAFLKAKYNTTVDITEVSGEDIRKWYHGDNYKDSGTGSLRESCMRHRRCQKYMNIYTENDVRMIIATKDNMLVGRAIVWPRSIWNKNYFDNTDAIVDRIYGNDNTIQQIKMYCQKNNYVHKERQSYNDELMWVHYINGMEEIKSRKCRMNINTEFDYYPYMDTFKYCSDGYLMNESDSYDIELTCTDGYRNNECHDCNGEIGDEPCSMNGYDYCEDCVTWVDSRDAYFPNDEVVYSERDGESYAYDDTCTTIDDQYIHSEDALTSIADTYVHKSDAVLSYIHDDTKVYIDEDSSCKMQILIDTNEYPYDSRMSDVEYLRFIKYVLVCVGTDYKNDIKSQFDNQDHNSDIINNIFIDL